MAGDVDVDGGRAFDSLLVQRLRQDQVLVVDPERPVAGGQGQVDVLADVAFDPQLPNQISNAQVFLDEEAGSRTPGLQEAALVADPAAAAAGAILRPTDVEKSQRDKQAQGLKLPDPNFWPLLGAHDF